MKFSETKLENKVLLEFLKKVQNGDTKVTETLNNEFYLEKAGSFEKPHFPPEDDSLVIVVLGMLPANQQLLKRRNQAVAYGMQPENAADAAASLEEAVFFSTQDVDIKELFFSIKEFLIKLGTIVDKLDARYIYLLAHVLL